jgi:hypothetical protein
MAISGLGTYKHKSITFYIIFVIDMMLLMGCKFFYSFQFNFSKEMIIEVGCHTPLAAYIGKICLIRNDLVAAEAHFHQITHRLSNPFRTME